MAMNEFSDIQALISQACQFGSAVSVDFDSTEQASLFCEQCGIPNSRQLANIIIFTPPDADCANTLHMKVTRVYDDWILLRLTPNGSDCRMTLLNPNDTTAMCSEPITLKPCYDYGCITGDFTDLLSFILNAYTQKSDVDTSTSKFQTEIQ